MESGMLLPQKTKRYYNPAIQQPGGKKADFIATVTEA